MSEKTEGAIKNGQTRETDNIGYTRQRTNKAQKHHNTENSNTDTTQNMKIKINRMTSFKFRFLDRKKYIFSLD